MRISYWSSDVCSSDLPAVHPAVLEKSLVHHFGTSVGPTVVDAVGAVFRHERLEAARLRIPHELDERLHAAVRAMTAVCPAPRRRRAHLVEIIPVVHPGHQCSGLAGLEGDRKSVGPGTRWSVRVDLGG